MMGLSDEQYRERRPLLTRENETVIAVWNFCGGWNPDALPLALAFYDVKDCDAMITLLLALRVYFDKRAALERETVALAGRG